jgi:hypothetical protein
LSDILRRREVAVGLCAVILLTVLFGRLLAIDGLRSASSLFTNWGSIVLAFSVGYGSVHLILMEVQRIQRRDFEWYFSIWTLVMLVIAFSVSMFIRPITVNDYVVWLLNSISLPTDATLYASSGLAIIFATYKSMRIRNFESALFVITAFFGLFYWIPLIEASAPTIAALGSWMTNELSVGGARGGLIVLGFGAITLALRTILGYERGYFA